MIAAVVGRFCGMFAVDDVGVITADATGSQAASWLGLKALEAWRGPRVLHNIAEAAASFRPDWVVVLGADVMDGYYSPSMSVTLAAVADLMARRGSRSCLLGFSFNADPAAGIRKAFASLSPVVKVNVRDPISFERLGRFVSTKARLVADAAFMLRPETEFEDYSAAQHWVSCQHNAGQTVLGVNLHPMLIRDGREQHVRQLIGSASAALAELASSRHTSFLLLPHDYRGSVSDNRCLTPLADRLRPRLGDRVLHLSGEYTAARLKALAGLADGVISSRMHLAIAAFGVGRPVFAFTYQDKFHGLFQQFGFPDWLLAAPPSDKNRAELNRTLNRFVDELQALRCQVGKRLVSVEALSELNLDL